MRNLKRAFGNPDPEFHERIQQTLFRIEEKEEEPVKKKLTLSMAFTAILCFCFLTAAVYARSAWSPGTPDATHPPLSQSSIHPETVVWAPDRTDSFYHVSELCPFADGEPLISMMLSTAISLGDTLCPICGNEQTTFYHPASASGSDLNSDPVYSSLQDEYYHFDQSCPKAISPDSVPLDTAIKNGKIPCSGCMSVYLAAVNDPMQTEVWHMSLGDACMAAPDEALLVPLDQAYGMLPACRWCILYVSPDSGYIHRDPLCSQLSSASPCSYGYAEKTGKESCPVCCSDEWPSPSLLGGYGDVSYNVSHELLSFDASIRYASANDLCYHKDTSCIHLLGTEYKGASESEMIESGKAACPWCLRDVWYISDFSSCYHADSNCSGIMDLAPCPVDDPRIEALSPCTVCALEVVFCAEDSRLYHLTSACTAFDAGTLSETSIVKAQSEGRIPCPFCLDSLCIYWPDGTESSEYHLDLCSEMESIKDHSGTIQGTFFDAESCGLSLCPVCAEITGVFWSPDDPNRFHKDSTCAETNVSVPARIIEMRLAAQNGMQPCSDCTAGFVYAHPWSAVYHSDYSCSGISPSNLRIMTLQEAAASGRTACPDCAHSAPRTVLFSDENDCYHTVAACADIVGQTRLLSEPAAIAAGRSACAECLYCYVSASDRSVFHMDPGCSSASDLEDVFAVDAIASGSMPCPDCVYWTSPEDALYHDSSECTNCGEVSSAPCTLDYALMTGRTYCVDWQEMQTASQVDVLIGKRDVYFIEDEDSLYHLYPECPGEKRVYSMLLSDALSEGRVACENCLTIYTHSNPGRSSALYESMLSAPLKAPSDQTATLTVGAEGIQDNLYSALPVSQDKWISGSLTVHSLLVLTTRAGIYLEAEFTLTDPSIDPKSIRMTYYCEGYGSFGWDSASVTPIVYENGETGYILQTVIPKLTLPDSALNAEQGGTMSLRGYGKTMDGQSELCFIFE